MGKFGSVFASMHTLFVGGVLPDQAELVEEAGQVHWVFRVAIIVYLLLTCITLLNMLVGILCEVVGCVAAEERDNMLINFVSTEMLKLLRMAVEDPDGPEVIRKLDFEKLLDLPRAKHVFKTLGVDVTHLEGLKEFMFVDNGELSYTEFMGLVMQLRSSNVATVKDVVELRKYIYLEFKRLGQCVGVGHTILT